MQHEFPQGYILKVSYFGKLGRRLLASADASQLIDFPDSTGGSAQTLSQAESGMVTQLRQYASRGEYGSAASLSAQPWFEDELAGLANYLNTAYGGNYFANNTQAAAYLAYPYSPRAATFPIPSTPSRNTCPQHRHGRAIRHQQYLDQQRFFQLQQHARHFAQKRRLRPAIRSQLHLGALH